VPFKLIKGTYHVRNYSPDGDSIRFRPDDPGLVHGLAGSTPRFNVRNHVQLRIEAIDTLETHFTPPSGGGTLHQPLKQANAATDKLMEFVGIKNVEWDSAHTIVTKADDETQGYILARTVEKNGRPVAFVYAGDPSENDGDDVFLDVDRLQSSYNHLALAEGYAYPTYYRGLFRDLRDALTTAVEGARNQGLRIHEVDRTNAGFNASTLQSIVEEHTIFPKLFRRLAEYMVNGGTAESFKRKLAQSREPVLDLRESNFTHFDTFVEQADNSVDIRLTRRPEELVFDEMPARPRNVFSVLMGGEVAEPRHFLEVLSLLKERLPEEAVQDSSPQA
jgi:hypothetical protein